MQMRGELGGVHLDAMRELLADHRAATDNAHAAGCTAVDAVLSAAPTRGGGTTLKEFEAQHVRWQAGVPPTLYVARRGRVSSPLHARRVCTRDEAWAPQLKTHKFPAVVLGLCEAELIAADVLVCLLRQRRVEEEMTKQARHATERMTALLAMAPKPGARINPSELEAMQRLLHHQAAAQLSQQRELRGRIDDGVHALASTTVAVGGGRPSTRAVLQQLWTRQQRALEAGQADWVRSALKRSAPLLSLVPSERWCMYASDDR